MSAARVIITTILGVIAGFVCWWLASSGRTEALAWGLVVNIILARTLLGFAIGISAWKMPWWLHGIIFGIIFSLPLAFGGYAGTAAEVEPAKSPWFVFWGTIVMGIIYGFLIELITSVIFKAKQA